jgi:co-chaperonin GroES (HSP10)
MSIKPVFRHIHISRDSGNQEESLVLLPEDYKKKEEPYQVVTVVSAAEDVRFEVQPGDKIIVDAKMIQEIKTNVFEEISVILDNYVVGVLTQ